MSEIKTNEIDKEEEKDIELQFCTNAIDSENARITKDDEPCRQI
jgi:hypothetical protein